MDNELHRMQAQASKLCDVTLRRIEKQKKPTQEKGSDEQMLLLGLMLILAMEKADIMLIIMLLYIFA